MKKRIVVALAALNVAVGVALFHSGVSAQTEVTEGIYNCCKVSVSNQTFCCSDCCWNPLGSECKASSQCR
jgi:hypothetical protein